MTAETSNARGEVVAWFPTNGRGEIIRTYGDGSPVYACRTKEEAEQAKRCHLGATGPVIPLYTAQQPAPSAPVGVEAVRGAWLAAITLANNICVQESDRENDRDGDTGWIDGTAECAKRIREYAHPTDAELLEMLDEAGANAAKAALAQQPAAEFRNDGNSEADFIAHHADACTACGGSGHKADQQPAAPSGEAVEKWGQSYRCGCFLGFPTKAAIPGHCPQHLRDKNGTALPLAAAPQQPADVVVDDTRGRAK